MSSPNSTNTYQPGLSAELVKKKYAVSKVIKLASNENPLGPSPKSLKAIKSIISNIHRYPDSIGLKLRKKLASKYNIKNFREC